MCAQLTSGPWNVVNDSANPFDDSPQALVALRNGYLVNAPGEASLWGFLSNPQSPTGVAARPGASIPTSLPLSGAVGMGVFTHTASDGTIYNFLFGNGHVWRLNTALSTATDVTPTNVPISIGSSMIPGSVVTRFIYCQSILDSIVVTDGLYKPWVMTNLASTPVTATQIDYHTPVVALSRGTTDTQVASASLTFQCPVGTPAGVIQTLAAVPAGTALPSGTIPLNTWGVFLVQVDVNQVVYVTAGAENFSVGYASEAFAIAGLPTKDATRWTMGYFTVQTKVGSAFIDGTDALHGGASGNVANATNYYAGDSDPWVAWGAPTLYQGSVFLITQTIAGVGSRTNFAWCEPEQPLVGWNQTNYTDFWNFIEAATAPLTALQGTASGLYVARALAWTAVTGTPGVNFSTQGTTALVSENIGTIAPATVKLFGDNLYFTDQFGRPNRLAVGSSKVEPIWQNMQTAVASLQGTSGINAATIASYTWGAIEPNLNIYLCAAYPTASSPYSPTVMYVFDAVTGRYFGQWDFGGQQTLDIGGIVQDANGQPCFLAIGMKSGGTNGQLWKLNRLFDAVWKENGATLTVSAETGRLGYSATQLLNASRATVICLNNVALSVTVTTPNTASTVVTSGDSPGASNDGTFRTVIGTDVRVARGMQFTISPNTTTAQWFLQQITVEAVACNARVEDL